MASKQLRLYHQRSSAIWLDNKTLNDWCFGNILNKSECWADMQPFYFRLCIKHSKCFLFNDRFSFPCTLFLLIWKVKQLCFWNFSEELCFSLLSGHTVSFYQSISVLQWPMMTKLHLCVYFFFKTSLCMSRLEIVCSAKLLFLRCGLLFLFLLWST